MAAGGMEIDITGVGDGRKGNIGVGLGESVEIGSGTEVAVSIEVRFLFKGKTSY